MGCGSNILRCFLVLFNTFFVLFAGLLFVAAIWSDISYREYFDIVNVQPVLEFLFATSVTIFVISVAGWAAAYKEHRGLLKIYLSLLVIVFSAQLLLCIFALAYQDEILPYLERGMLSALEAFSPNSPIQIGFNEMQKDLKCCGVRNATDWDLSNVWKNVSSQIITDNNLIPAGPYRVPDSCCVFLSDFCGITNATAENIFTDGCADTLKVEVQGHVNLSAIIMSVICFLQLASIMFSGCIINRQEDESEDLDPLITNDDQQQPTR